LPGQTNGKEKVRAMKTRTMTYYERDGHKLREITRVLVDAYPDEKGDASLEPIVWQCPLIIAPVLWGCDGKPRNSTEIECLVRYTMMCGRYVCVVTEGATQKREVFVIQNITNWQEELEFEVAIWLSVLFGGTPALCLALLGEETPPPPDEIIPFGGSPTVSLIDGYGALGDTITCPECYALLGDNPELRFCPRCGWAMKEEIS
jgi:hypothetical protein